jgi:hypothetical protein
VLDTDDCGVFDTVEGGWSLIAGWGGVEGVPEDLFGFGVNLVRWNCIVFPVGKRDAMPRQNRLTARKIKFDCGKLVATSGEAGPLRFS